MIRRWFSLSVLVVSAFLLFAGSEVVIDEGPSTAKAGTKKKGDNDRKKGKSRGKRRGKSGHNRGRIGHGRLSSKPPNLTSGQRRSYERKFKKVNPPFKSGAKGNIPPPSTSPLADTDGDEQFDGNRLSDPFNGVSPPTLPGGSVTPTALGPYPSTVSSGGVSTAAANDFLFFRNQWVIQGSNATNISSQTNEPTVANDRNAVLYTGNSYAAVSPDNGITWQYPDPFTQFPSASGGFCCDQKAYAVDRGGHSLVFWFLQYFRDGNGNNTQRLVTYQGRNELLDQADYCINDFTPQADFGYPTNRWLDFPQVAASNDHLYMSSNVFDTQPAASGGTTANWRGSVVWRIELDDLDDNDCDADFTFWDIDDEGSPGLVEGAGSTMYWAAQNGANTRLRINHVSDSSTDDYYLTRNITDFATSGGGNSNCPTPDGLDPCQFADARINTGWYANGEAGWLWNVAQGSGYSFPYVQGARFQTSNYSRTGEMFLYNQNYAWSYPSVAPNDRGHLGITLYRIGGGNYPRARAMLMDDITGWNNLSPQGIVTSTNGTSRNRWGDYGGVSPYGDCENSWGSAVYSMQGGSTNGNAEARFAWFGRERDGCPDLRVEDSFGFAPTTIKVGEPIFLGAVTRNIGSATAGPSTTRFYLSRDDRKSSSDRLLGGVVSVSSLAAGDSEGNTAVANIPNGSHGTYYVLACADDTDQVSEITNANNCQAAEDTLVVPLSGGSVQFYADNLDIPHAPIDAGSLLRLGVEIRNIYPLKHRVELPIEIWLLREPDIYRHAKLITTRTLRVPDLTGQGTQQPGDGQGQDPGGPGGGDTSGSQNVISKRFKLRVRLPRKLRRSHYYIALCTGKKKKPTRSRCVPSTSVLHVER